jgi:hypothetical protein
MTPQLDRYRVLFPDWYDERAEAEAEDKGWLQGVRVELADGGRYPVHFYDPVRLAQDLAEEAKWGGTCVAEPGLIVVSAVTRDGIRKAVDQLLLTDYFTHLRDENFVARNPHPSEGGTRHAADAHTESQQTVAT